ncbi:MAG: hypothetical protein V8R40_14545 [Dysosmobacter sp.]
MFHQTVTDYDTVYISAGKIGAQVELAPRGTAGAAGRRNRGPHR